MAKRQKKMDHRVTLFALLGIFLSVLLFSAILGSLHNSYIVALDQKLSEYIYSFRSPLLTEGMLVITSFGDSVLAMGSILVTTLLIWKKETREALFFLSVVLLGLGINLLIKDIVQRPRPDIAPLVTLSSYSFPSGHAMNAFIFYGLLVVLAFLIIKSSLVRSIIGIVCFLIVMLVGFSRIYLGVHYPSDVIAGFLGGMAIVLPSFLILRRQIFQ